MAQKAQQHPTTSNETSHLVIIFLSDFVVQFSLQLFLTDLGGNQLKEFCSLAKPHWPQCVFLKQVMLRYGVEWGTFYSLVD